MTLHPVNVAPVEVMPRSAMPQRHGAIVAHVAFLLSLQFKRNDVPGRVAVAAGVVPEQWGDRRTRVFDLAITLAGPSAADELLKPIILIDLVSPATEDAAREKAWACTTIPSVSEIVLLSTQNIAAEILCRDDEGNWPEQPDQIGRGARLALKSIGFDRRLSELFETSDL
jgi:Uma2 family endonuclease